jgi:hypothetical protein
MLTPEVIVRIAAVGRGLCPAVMLSLLSAVGGAQAPLPLDPLTPGEQALADTVARADPRVREMLGRGSRLVYVEFLALKEPQRAPGAEEAPPRRSAEVLFYVPERDQGVRVLVDLAARRVVEQAPVPGQSVPLSAEEVAAAARLALADQRVVQLFGGRMPAFRVATAPATRASADSARIEGLRTVGATPRDPCYRRRCVALFFRVGNRYVHMNRVIVDLTGQRVIVQEGER